MNRLQFMLLAFFFTAGLAFAQMKPPSSKDMVKDLEKRLELTDEQTERIEAIFEKYMPKTDRPPAGKPQGNKEMKMGEGQKKMNEMDEEIAKVLNSEQKEKFKKIMEERKKNMDRMMPPPPGGKTN